MIKKYGLAIGMVALLGSCSPHEKKHEQTAEFKVTSAIQKDTTLFNEYVCQIHAFQHIELRALEKGYLQEILVDEGQFVKKGQLLFQIQPTIYQNEVQKAEAEVAFAQIEYENAQALAQKDVVSQNEVALTKARLQKAKAELSLAQTHLSFTQIRAPFDGIVGKFQDVRLGSLLDEGELLTTLSDNSKMWVYFNIPEAEYLNYALGEKGSLDHLHLRLANGSEFSEEGVIETIISDFDNTTGNIPFRATFPNPERILRHGQTGTILWPKVYSNALMIPQKTTFEILEKKFVYAVDSKGLVSPKEVQILGELNHVYLIKGLSPNTNILLEGLRKVESGDNILFEKVNPDSVLHHLDLHAE